MWKVCCSCSPYDLAVAKSQADLNSVTSALRWLNPLAVWTLALDIKFMPTFEELNILFGDKCAYYSREDQPHSWNPRFNRPTNRIGHDSWQTGGQVRFSLRSQTALEDRWVFLAALRLVDLQVSWLSISLSRRTHRDDRRGLGKRDEAAKSLSPVFPHPDGPRPSFLLPLPTASHSPISWTTSNNRNENSSSQQETKS